MRTFLAVHRAGSLTRAARELGISQPSVTVQIRALEAQLSAALFVREARGVIPTGAADRLARLMAPHLDALAKMVDGELTGTDPMRRVVHLAGPAELVSTLVLPALADLVAEGMQVRVTFGLPEAILDGLVSGEHDLIVTTVRPRRRGVSSTPLTDEEFLLVGTPVWCERVPADPITDRTRALDSLPIVAYAENLPIVRRYWRTVFERPPAMLAAVVVPDLRAVRMAVLAGMGISVLPRYLIADDLLDGSLAALLEPEVPPINTLHVAVRAGTDHQPHIAVVRNRLLAVGGTW